MFGTILLIAWIALNLADVWTTHRGLATNPHAREANPVPAALMRFGGEWFMHGTKLVVSTGVGVMLFLIAPPWVLLLLIVPLCWVVWSNSKAIR
jgi:hypothetical protein